MITNASVLQDNMCLSNVSTNYWIANASVYNDNVCLANVSTNYWISNSSLSNLTGCAQNISSRLYNTYAIAISSLAEVNVLALTLGLVFVVANLEML